MFSETNGRTYADRGGRLCCRDGSWCWLDDRMQGIRSIAFQVVVELTRRLARECWVHLHCQHRGRENTAEILDVASEQLRLLAHVVELTRDGPTAFLVVNSVAQDGFIEALANNIQTFEAILAQPTSTPKLDARRSSDASCQLMALLLQFMAFRGVWTSKARSLSEGLCKSIFNLALVTSKRPPRD